MEGAATGVGGHEVTGAGSLDADGTPGFFAHASTVAAQEGARPAPAPPCGARETVVADARARPSAVKGGARVESVRRTPTAQVAGEEVRA
ncbi:hypothetical protein GCM10010293_65800 [Streptomyces griseoflavus]|nr:hypothetical protein GCM10010293_65800 [Streptomyces griseoflavus]